MKCGEPLSNFAFNVNLRRYIPQKVFVAQFFNTAVSLLAGSLKS
jgi:hypothetical protein